MTENSNQQSNESGIKVDPSKLPPVVTDDEVFREVMRTRELAIEGVRELMPDDVRDCFDYDKLAIEPVEYLDGDVLRKSADCAFSIPVRPEFAESPDDVADVRIILEQKTRIRPSEVVSILLQVMLYVVLECKRQLATVLSDDEAEDSAEKKEKLLVQPIVIVVYTGSNRSLKELRIRDVFRLPAFLRRFYMEFPIHFVNMTRMRDEGFRSGHVFLEAMYSILTSHSREEVIKTASTALREIPEYDNLSAAGQSFVKLFASVYYRRALKHDPENAKNRVTEFLDVVVNKKKETLMTIINGFLSPEEQEVCVSFGFGKGRLAERAEIIVAHYAAIRRETVKRFGSFPDSLMSSLTKITNVNDLLSLHSFVIATAESLEDVSDRIDELKAKQQ